MKLGSLLPVVTVVVLGACAPGDGPPEVTVDRDACDHCGMLISDLDFVGAYRLPGESPRVFDDLGCLLDELRGLPAAASAVVWFREFAGDSWLARDAAVFVRSGRLHTPMGGNLVAVADLDAATRLAEQLDGEVIDDFDRLLQGLPEETHR